MKTCTKCKIEKELESFGKRSGKQSHLYKSWCKQCYSDRNAERLKERYHTEDGFKDKLKKYRLDNPDKIAAYKAKDYQKNRGAYLVRAKKWAAANNAVVRQAKRRYKLKRAEWELTGTFTEEQWLMLCKSYGNICLGCGRGDRKLTQDHVVPLSRGGLNVIENIQPLCGPCNSSKHTKTIDFRINYEGHGIG
jgi:hypothetical protein